MSSAVPTLGQRRVGVDFNPSGDPTIAGIKRQAAELIDAVNAIPAGDATAERGSAEDVRQNEIRRLKATAMTQLEGAAMWAVKAAARASVRE